MLKNFKFNLVDDRGADQGAPIFVEAPSLVEAKHIMRNYVSRNYMEWTYRYVPDEPPRHKAPDQPVQLSFFNH